MDHLQKMLIFLKFPMNVLDWSSEKKEKPLRILPISQEQLKFR
jgi:hypothetical protein